MLKFLLMFLKMLFGMALGFNAVKTTVAVTADPTATMNQKRTVGDKVRWLFPQFSFMTLVATGPVERLGHIKTSPVRIGKKASKTVRFESFTYTPLSVSAIATSLSTLTLTLDSSTGIVADMTLVNSSNNTVARVDTITSSTVVEIDSVGSTAFSVTSGDVLVYMAPASESNSSNPPVLWKELDNLYNLLQTARFAVSIAGDTAPNPNHAGGDLVARLVKQSAQEGLRKVNHSMMFSERASSGNKTSGANDSFATTRGLLQWRANTYDAGGNMTPEKYRDNQMRIFPNNVDPGARLIQFSGQRIFAQMQEWVNDKLMFIDESAPKVFGARSTVFVTSTNQIEVVRDPAWDIGSYARQSIMMNPEELFYCYRETRDLQPRKNIQANDVDGVKHEIFGDFGLGTLDGGQSVMSSTRWY